MTTAFPRISGRCRRGSTTQRFIQFQERPFIQRDEAGARSIDVRNYCNDDRDENWKNVSFRLAMKLAVIGDGRSAAAATASAHIRS